jgi:2-methylcitrate dehydratase PrpD
MAEKVRVEVDPEIEKVDPVGFAGAKVVVKTKNGNSYIKRVDHPKGTYQNPMNMEDVIERFNKCVPFGIKPLSKANADQLIEVVNNLENVSDVSVIADLLT